jgi:hypothetical protein
MALVADVIVDLKQKLRNCPGDTIIRAYIRAAREFCGESRWMRLTLAAATSPNVQLYSLGNDPNLEILAVSAVSVTVPGTPLPIKVALPPIVGMAMDPNLRPGVPVEHSYVPEGQIAFNPTPDKVYPVTITLIVQPKVTAVELPDELLVKWDRTFQAGALAYLFEIPGEVWANPQQALMEMAKFRSGKSNAKADAQRQYQTGGQRLRPRRFVV